MDETGNFTIHANYKTYKEKYIPFQNTGLIYSREKGSDEGCGGQGEFHASHTKENDLFQYVSDDWRFTVTSISVEESYKCGCIGIADKTITDKPGIGEGYSAAKYELVGC